MSDRSVDLAVAAACDWKLSTPSRADSHRWDVRATSATSTQGTYDNNAIRYQDAQCEKELEKNTHIARKPPPGGHPELLCTEVIELCNDYREIKNNNAAVYRPKVPMTLMSTIGPLVEFDVSVTYKLQQTMLQTHKWSNFIPETTNSHLKYTLKTFHTATDGQSVDRTECFLSDFATYKL